LLTTTLAFLLISSSLLTEDTALSDESRVRVASLASRTKDAKLYASAILNDKKQFICLDELWERESNWRHNVKNPNSSAYGIPQALPGKKMAEAGHDWKTNPITQVKWGLRYIEKRYKSPCNALLKQKRQGWY
jgi:hypothetical protein